MTKNLISIEEVGRSSTQHMNGVRKSRPVHLCRTRRNLEKFFAQIGGAQ